MGTVSLSELVALTLNAVQRDASDADWTRLDQLILGSRLPDTSAPLSLPRQAAKLAGLPPQVPGLCVDRGCASGLDAVILGARQIQCGEGHLVLAGGADHAGPRPPAAEARLAGIMQAHGVTQSEIDRFAREAHPPARVDPRTVSPAPALSADVPAPPEMTRTREGDLLAPMATGAAVVLLASEQGIARHGLMPLAEYLGSATAAASQAGVGPVAATEKLCARLGLVPHDFDLFEMAAASAAQAVAVCRELGFDPFSEQVLPEGSTLTLGHPAAMTGARLVGEAARRVGDHKAFRALASAGVTQGVALALRRV